MGAGTKVGRIRIVVSAGLLVASAANAQQPASRGGPQAPEVVSPEVMPDRRIVFRILAPQAQNVRIVGTDIPSLAGGGRGAPGATNASVVRKAENGVWEVTLGPVPPSSYRYNFNVDGVSVIDPRNPATSESNTNTWSLVHVPGAEFMDTLQVPHGGVTSVTYYSTALGRFRRMHVYTRRVTNSGETDFRFSICCTAPATATRRGAPLAGRDSFSIT